MELSSLFAKLAIAVGLGLLVGFERERVASRLGGVRTFPLVTVLGSLSALLAASLGPLVIPAALLSLAALIVIGNVPKLRDAQPHFGLTTEMAMLVMFGVGALLFVGPPEIAVVTGAGVAVLLHAKISLHGMVTRLGDDDVAAIMRFALISLVVLPVLPNRTYGPYDVLNPRQIWLMVVLIVGIGLTGFVLYKFFGGKKGLLLAGILGGLVSSTATTASYARRTAGAPEASKLAAGVILISWSILMVRVMAEIAIVAPDFFKAVAVRLGLMVAVAILTAAFFWQRGATDGAEAVPQKNPSELAPALLYALVYSIVLLGTAVARERFGTSGFYVLAALAGLTDVDAITLSTAQLVNAGRLHASEGSAAIVTAVVSNAAFKTVIVALLGDRHLLHRVAAAAAVLGAAGAVVLAYR